MSPRARDHDEDPGGGASRSTDPAAGSSAATDVSLRELESVVTGAMDKFEAKQNEWLEKFLRAEIAHLDDKTQARFTSLDEGITVAKDAADATLLAHNGLLKKMEDQAEQERLERAAASEKFAPKDYVDQRVERAVEKMESVEEHLTEKIDTSHDTLVLEINDLKGFRWKVTGALILVGVFLPTIVAGIVYLLTRTAIPTNPTE